MRYLRATMAWSARKGRDNLGSLTEDGDAETADVDGCELIVEDDC